MTETSGWFAPVDYGDTSLKDGYIYRKFEGEIFQLLYFTFVIKPCGMTARRGKKCSVKKNGGNAIPFSGVKLNQEGYEFRLFVKISLRSAISLKMSRRELSIDVT